MVSPRFAQNRAEKQCIKNAGSAGSIFRICRIVFKLPPFDRGRAAYLKGMNYLLAILLPPLSILLTGRIILAILVFFIWIPALIFSGGLTHPMFILLAWFLIFHAREDRRHRRDLS